MDFVEQIFWGFLVCFLGAYNLALISQERICYHVGHHRSGQRHRGGVWRAPTKQRKHNDEYLVVFVRLRSIVADRGRWLEAEPSPGAKCLKRSRSSVGAAGGRPACKRARHHSLLHTVLIQTTSTPRGRARTVVNWTGVEGHGATAWKLTSPPASIDQVWSYRWFLVPSPPELAVTEPHPH